MIEQEKIIKEVIIEEGEAIKVHIDDYSHEGFGIAHVNGKRKDGTVLENFPIFIFGAMTQENGYAKLTKVNASLAYAEVETIFESSKNKGRVMPICPLYGKCGGCDLMHMNYESQLAFKTKTIQETLSKIGGLVDLNILPTIGMTSKPLYYRNKVQVPVQEIYRGKTACGFYERESHKIIPLNECFIQSNTSTSIVKFVKNIFTEYGLKGYNEQYHNGVLRHILIRRNNDESEIMIVIVLKDFEFLDTKPKELIQIVDKIVTRYPNVTTIVANLNPKPGNTIIGDVCKTLYGKGYITDVLCGKTFRIGPKSFYQVNHEQCEKLYSKAIELAELSLNDTIIDAYCGIGTIGLIASPKVKEVYSVEIVDEAIEFAKENAILNNITNAHFECGKSEEQTVKWEQSGIHADCVFVDPPRKGCDQKFLSTIVEMKIPKIIYVSCDPATLARDLKYLVSENYLIKVVQPVDMFSQNHHVETVICLLRK